MRKDKELAIQLRLSGRSYKSIHQELDIPIATLSGWFKNQPWSREIKNRLSSQVSLANPKTLEIMAHANRERWKLKHEEYRTAAIKEFGRLKEDPLFWAGLMLYWAEGEKQSKSSQVRLGNSDPEMIKIFYLFLSKSLKISPDKISACLLLYPDLIDSVQKNYWSKTTGIPLEKFKKSIYIKGRHTRKRLSFGVCTVFVSSRALKERILRWITLCQNHLEAYALNIENAA